MPGIRHQRVRSRLLWSLSAGRRPILLMCSVVSVVVLVSCTRKLQCDAGGEKISDNSSSRLLPRLRVVTADDVELRRIVQSPHVRRTMSQRHCSPPALCIVPYGARPVLVLRLLTCGSCTVYIHSNR